VIATLTRSNSDTTSGSCTLQNVSTSYSLELGTLYNDRERGDLRESRKGGLWTKLFKMLRENEHIYEDCLLVCPHPDLLRGERSQAV